MSSYVCRLGELGETNVKLVDCNRLVWCDNNVSQSWSFEYIFYTYALESRLLNNKYHKVFLSYLSKFSIESGQSFPIKWNKILSKFVKHALTLFFGCNVISHRLRYFKINKTAHRTTYKSKLCHDNMRICIFNKLKKLSRCSFIIFFLLFVIIYIFRRYFWICVDSITVYWMYQFWW